MASILEGFLVRLGFEVDQDGMQKFNASVSAVATRVANVGKAAAATGVALGAAFIKATKDVNELYKVANNNGVSIKSFTAISQAVERVGGNAENVGAAFNSLTQNIKTYGRGFESMLKNQLGVSLYDQTGKMRDMGDVFMDLRNKLAEIARMDARISLTSQISEASYPDLELQDIYGRKIRLSSLAGKVVLLDFWSAELGNSNVYNAELKETYRKYADAPTSFEVYQVAIDTSKPLWITAVQEQQLPWISVSDLRGRASTALTLYNVQKLPANFLIDRQGTIVARDIYGKSLEEKLDELTR